jgi:quinol monooxygenase YgiN
MMGRIAIIVEFEPHAEQASDFLRKLEQDAAETLNDDGCLRMEVLRTRDGSGRIVLSELWRDEAAIEAHRTKPGHSHEWQVPMLKSKRVLSCDYMQSISSAESALTSGAGFGLGIDPRLARQKRPG